MNLRRKFGVGAALAVVTLAGAVASPAFAATQTATDLTNPTLTPELLVDALVGDGTPTSNVVYTGDPRGAGTVSGFEDPFGIDSGVFLSSGAAVDNGSQQSSIIGPNEQKGTTTNFHALGDDDLAAIVGAYTADASVLEFDFVPTSDTVTFSYVFGSEEYEEFVDASFNDVFAFFVNGQNYAVLPDGTPVSINNINHLRNTEYYKSNHEVTTYNTELDGFTTVLTFEAPVTQGATNHIKLAIADVADNAYDSTVLIAAGSFRSNSAPTATDVSLQTEFESPIDVTLQGTDPDGDALTYSIVDAPAAEQGTVSVVNGNQVTFTPAEGFTGDATFTYQANDGSVSSAPATVTVEVLEEGVILTPPPTTPAPTEPVETTPGPTEPGATEPVETTPGATEPVETTPGATEPVETTPGATAPTETIPPSATATSTPASGTGNLAQTGAAGLTTALLIGLATVTAGAVLALRARARRDA